MLLDFIQITPYLAIAATLIVAGTILTVCLQSGDAPKGIGFAASRDRRRVSYRGAVGASRKPTPRNDIRKAQCRVGQ